MSLSLTDRDPVLVTQMVNRLAEIFVEESLSLKRSHEQNVRRLLEEKLSVARETMEHSDAALKEFKQSHFISLDSEVQAQLNKLTESERAKTVVKRQMDDLADLFDQLNATSAGADGDSKKKEELKYIYRQIANLAAFEGDPNMGVLKQRLADLEDQRAKLQRGESHPAVIALESQVDAVHAQIKKLALDRQKTLGTELEKLTDTIDSLRGKLRQLPEEERRLAELTRDRKVNEELYAMLLTETQKAQITEAVKTQDVDILDPAIEPEHPLNRDKKKKAALGAVFGFVLGVGLALGIELLDKSIKTPEDVKKYLKLPVLGNIPLIEFDEALEFQDSQKIKQIDSQLVTHDYSPTPIGEAYRSLRTNILFSKTTGRIKSMVITSTAPSDGKSFTATNLAIAIAQQKNNTLLVDGDLRRGVLHNTFSVPKEPGLTNFLTNTASLLEIINETHIPNLSLMTCGSLMPNPSELLGSPQMRKFLDDVVRRFDVVIFDSPPLNAATDAVVIGTQVDGVAIVVRAGKTDRDIARQKLELFSHLPSRVIGVILNGVEPDMGHEGYSYYHY